MLYHHVQWSWQATINFAWLNVVECVVRGGAFMVVAGVELALSLRKDNRRRAKRLFFAIAFAALAIWSWSVAVSLLYTPTPPAPRPVVAGIGAVVMFLFVKYAVDRVGDYAPEGARLAWESRSTPPAMDEIGA